MLPSEFCHSRIFRGKAQQKDTAQYLASLEASYRTTESQIFGNISATSYPWKSVPGYASLNLTTITNPNDSVSKVDYTGSSGQKTGPNLLLKVMSGDTLKIAVQSFYNTNSITTTNSSFNDVLVSLATGLYNTTSGAHGNLGQLEGNSSTVYTGLTTTHEYEDGKKEKVQSKFGNFTSVEAGFEGYLKLLNKNYPDAIKALRDNNSTISDFTSGLMDGKKGAYATDPNYESKIQNAFNSVVAEVKKEVSDEITTTENLMSQFYKAQDLLGGPTDVGLQLQGMIDALTKKNDDLKNDLKNLNKLK